MPSEPTALAAPPRRATTGRSPRPAPAAAAFPWITLATPHLRVSVCPRLGRIVEFARPGGDSFLWLARGAAARPEPEFGYVNFGGDKVWPALHFQWPRFLGRMWPPDGVLDGGPWAVTRRSARSVTIQSRECPRLHVVLRRTIVLHPRLARLTVRTTMTRTAASHIPVTIWSITQARHGRTHLLGVAPDRADRRARPFVNLAGELDPGPAAVAAVAGGRAVRYDPPLHLKTKVGALGTWLAALYERDIFLQTTRFDPRGCYPDNSNLQFYADRNYLEIETLSPTIHLQPGGRLDNRVTWELLPATGPQSDSALARRLAARAQQFGT